MTRNDSVDRGAILMILCLMIVPITIITAVVVDLGVVRWQRATLQNAADSAAVAGATQLSPSGSGQTVGDELPRTGCTEALASLRQNVVGFTATDVTGGCASLPATVSACTAASNFVLSTPIANGYVATITYPVPAATDVASQRLELVRAAGYTGDTTSVAARCRGMVVTVTRSDIGPYFAAVISSSGQSVSVTSIGLTTSTG